VQFGPGLIAALLILVAGHYAGRWVGGMFDRMLARPNLDVTARQLLLRQGVSPLSNSNESNADRVSRAPVVAIDGAQSHPQLRVEFSRSKREYRGLPNLIAKVIRSYKKLKKMGDL